MIRQLGLLALLLLGTARLADAQPAPGAGPAQQVVIPAAPAGIPAYNQITIAATATLIRSTNANRSAIVVVNHGSTNVFIGFTNAVTTSTGVMLVGIPGSSLTFQTRSDIYGIAASGTQAISFYEEVR
jgi:hypothetical protein